MAKVNVIFSCDLEIAQTRDFAKLATSENRKNSKIELAAVEKEIEYLKRKIHLQSIKDLHNEIEGATANIVAGDSKAGILMTNAEESADVSRRKAVRSKIQKFKSHRLSLQ